MPSPLATRQHTHRDIVSMYPPLRNDHLRYLEKCGVLKPEVVESDRFFGFGDLTLLRQIASELRQGATFRAVVRSLTSAKSGQLSFDFSLEAERARVIELKPRTEPSLDPEASLDSLSSAQRYFLMGSMLDDGSPEGVEEAIKGYRRALEDDPDLVPAIINLANIRYARDERAEALALYERAIVLDDSYFEAHFNLGNINHDLGRHGEAEAAYRSALAVNPDYADAQFYLAVTLEKMGRSIEARAHWKAYERLAPSGEWVDLAKEFSD